MSRWLALVVLAACKSTPQEETNRTEPPAATAIQSATVSALGAPMADIAWNMPQGWNREPTTFMRKASYTIPKVAGDNEDATVSVMQAGGSVDQNVTRWKSQLDNAHDFSRSDTQRDGLGVTLVEVHGTYTGAGVMVGESPNPRPGWGLLGAIITGEGLSQPWFFKMIGPDKTVAASRHDFQSLVDSIHKK